MHLPSTQSGRTARRIGCESAVPSDGLPSGNETGVCPVAEKGESAQWQRGKHCAKKKQGKTKRTHESKIEINAKARIVIYEAERKQRTTNTANKQLFFFSSSMRAKVSTHRAWKQTNASNNQQQKHLTSEECTYI